MPVINPFRRVELFSTLGGGSTFGTFSAVNVSNAIANSNGKPLDWWVRGDTAGNISNAFRKANSANLFTVAVLQPPVGTPNNGHLSAWGDATISWTDGPPGNVSGSTLNAHSLGDAEEGAGAGYRITVPNAPQWPDWSLLKVWAFDWPQRRMHYRASLDNPTADADEVWIDSYSPGPSPNALPGEYIDWSQTRTITHEIRFAADAAGQTLTFDMTRTWNYYVSIYAVALYRAAIVAQHPRGAARSQTAVQRGRPAGA